MRQMAFRDMTTQQLEHLAGQLGYNGAAYSRSPITDYENARAACVELQRRREGKS